MFDRCKYDTTTVEASASQLVSGQTKCEMIAFLCVSSSIRDGRSGCTSVVTRCAAIRYVLQVICVTYLPLVGYTILLRDLLAPLVEVMMGKELGGQARNIMVSVLVVLVRLRFPVMLRFGHPDVIRNGNTYHIVPRVVTTRQIDRKEAVM